MAWIGSSPTGEGTARMGTSIELESRRAARLLDLGVPALLGFAAAVVHTYLKLRLGIPGHAAVLWLTPLLVARAVSMSWGAGTLASTGTAVGLCALGGFGCRFPEVLEFGTYWVVGPVLDLWMQALGGWTRTAEGRRSLLVGPFGVAAMALAGLLANLSHLGSKLGFGVIRVHTPRFGLPPGVYDLVTFTVFGLAAGVLAYVISRPVLKRRAPGEKLA
jgi:hypothetical protein